MTFRRAGGADPVAVIFMAWSYFSFQRSRMDNCGLMSNSENFTIEGSYARIARSVSATRWGAFGYSLR